MPPLEIGDDGTASDAAISFYQDRYYVVITADGSAKDKQKSSALMARAVSQKIQKSSQLPDLLGILPSSHLVPRSQGYVSGLLGLNTQFYLGDDNILGINGRTVECVFAQYKIKDDQANLLAIRYRDPAAATAAAQAALKAFAEKYKAVSIEGIQAFSDKRNRLYFLVGENNLVYIISRADSIDLIKEIKLSLK
jgi:hypothetical protein